MLVLAALLVWAGLQARTAQSGLIPARLQLVQVLGLTDFSLWSEARYTRHPTMDDGFTPFQDFPSAPDHFPAGSLVAQPQRQPATQLKIRPQLKKGI
jgi:hypothetical protein